MSKSPQFFAVAFVVADDLVEVEVAAAAVDLDCSYYVPTPSDLSYALYN